MTTTFVIIVLICYVCISIFMLGVHVSKRDTNIYMYKHNKYMIIGHGKMKNTTTRVWEDCTFYHPVNDKMSVYARNTLEFCSLFKRVVK